MSESQEIIGISHLQLQRMTIIFSYELYPMLRNQLRNEIFKVTENNFEALALEIFNYQYSSNKTYHQYCNLIGRNETSVQSLLEIPFLPIEFFKTHKIISGKEDEQITFSSSGTTSEQTSKHYVNDLKLYKESFEKCFDQFFGDATQYCILALLPSYLERKGSSLVYMVESLMKKSGHPQNGFFLYDHDELFKRISLLEKHPEFSGQKTILIGVSFALLDFAEKFSFPLSNTIILETGGMKGRREELTRGELHSILKTSFHLKNIYSEYGMTELLSQAYSLGEGKFKTPPWMKIFLRDENDPLNFSDNKSSGAINVIDLANLDSCSFIATADVGRINADHSFEVLGRMDYSDVRGCNLIWEG